MYAIQHRYMSLKMDLSWAKLIYVIFQFVLLRVTIIYLPKHKCIHVRNFVRQKPHTGAQWQKTTSHKTAVRLQLIPSLGLKHTVLCKSNANDNRWMSHFVLVIYCHISISKTSYGLLNIKVINQWDIGTIFVISCRDIVLARHCCNDISQSKTIYCHNISL